MMWELFEVTKSLILQKNIMDQSQMLPMSSDYCKNNKGWLTIITNGLILTLTCSFY